MTRGAAASKSAGSGRWPLVANAERRKAVSAAPQLSSRLLAAAASASWRASARWAVVRKAHATLRIAWVGHRSTPAAGAVAASATASKSAGAATSSVANAHTVFESCCGEKDDRRGVAAAASASKSGSSAWPSLA